MNEKISKSGQRNCDCDHSAVEEMPNLLRHCYRKANRAVWNINRRKLRAACRAKSTADMINKLKIVEEESDETAYWLELIPR